MVLKFDKFYTKHTVDAKKEKIYNRMKVDKVDFILTELEDL